MIITNSIAKVVVKIGAWFTTGTLGVTIYPFIFVYPPEHAANERLVKHENCHLRQWLRYGIVGFPFVYITQFLRDGYDKMSLEQEAKNAERGE